MADSADEAKVFPVDTRFQQMARRPGGISREKALTNATSELENARPEVEDWLDHWSARGANRGVGHELAVGAALAGGDAGVGGRAQRGVHGHDLGDRSEDRQAGHGVGGRHFRPHLARESAVHSHAHAFLVHLAVPARGPGRPPRCRNDTGVAS